MLLRRFMTLNVSFSVIHLSPDRGPKSQRTFWGGNIKYSLDDRRLFIILSVAVHLSKYFIFACCGI